MSVTHDRDKREPTLGRGDPEPKLGGQDREPIPDLHDDLPPEPHENVADILRRARKEHGQDLRTVSQVLRIRYVYLEAIESGRFDRLPGTAYVVGFLRTYAEYLGLDGGRIVEQFKLETSGADAKTELIFPEPVTEGRIPSGAIILISALLMGVAYGGWFYLSNEGRSVADLIPPMPERLARLIGGDEEAPAPAASPDNTTTTAPAAQPAAEVAEILQPTAPPSETVEIAETPAEPEQEAALELEVAQDQPLPAPEQPLPAPVVVIEAPGVSTPVPEAPPVVVTQVSRLAPAQPAAADSQGESSTAAPRTTLAEVIRLQPNFPMLSTGPGAATPSESASAASLEPTSLVQQTLIIPMPPSVPETEAISGEQAPRVYGENNQDSRIIVRATQDSWVQIRDRNNALLLTRVLRTGDSYIVPNQDGLTLLTGNAGGIEIEVDGVKVPPIGPIGSVRRQIALDPGLLRAGNSAAH